MGPLLGFMRPLLDSVGVLLDSACRPLELYRCDRCSKGALLHFFSPLAYSKALFLSSMGLLSRSNAHTLDSKLSLLEILGPHACSIVTTASSYASRGGCNRFLSDILGPLLCSVGEIAGSNAPRAFSLGPTLCSLWMTHGFFGLHRCSNGSMRHFLGSLLYFIGPHRCSIRARACFIRPTDHSLAPHRCSRRLHPRSSRAVRRSDGRAVSELPPSRLRCSP